MAAASLSLRGSMLRGPSQRLATAVLLAASLSPSPAADDATGLFTSVAPAASASASLARPHSPVIRERLVRIDFSMLAAVRQALSEEGAPAAALRLNLFGDADLAALVERSHATSSGYALLGRIQAAGPSTLALVVHGDVVAGAVRTPQATYRIQTAGERIYAVSELDRAERRPGAAPVAVVPPIRERTR